ncbi:MAG: DUF4437 domain-containing protein [Myxococcota bacterium]
MRFRDGFASPPHIHNVTRRAVVLEGLVHITAAKGEDAGLAYVEIDDGPYLVRPLPNAVQGAERPVNVRADSEVAVACGTGEPCVFYVRAQGALSVDASGV